MYSVHAEVMGSVLREHIQINALSLCIEAFAKCINYF